MIDKIILNIKNDIKINFKNYFNNEKYSQTNLYNLLIKNNFDEKNIYFTPFKNPILKKYF